MKDVRTAIVDVVGDRIPPHDIDALAREVTAICAQVCRARAELWRNTALAKSDLPSAREEARARANEAQYLADALELAD